MTLETFFDKFELFAEAPNAVAKMRELILQLAVSGKLVPQDPSEGTAVSLVAQLSKARKATGRRSALGAEGGSDTEGWHPIPETWAWVTLAAIGQIVGGGTPRSENAAFFADEGIPWLTPADLNGYRAKRISRGRRCITEAGLASSSAQLLPEGSVLFSSRAPIGYVAIAGTKLATNQGFKSCVPYVEGISDYLYYYLKSAAARIDSEASGTTFREVSGRIVAQIPVPLPPLAEQRRIVAKVDELMALCDRLEAQQKERDERHVVLARASLSRFAESPTPANLDYLFHPSYPIPPADLRKAILTLAVQGKLVPQDPSEEGVEAWLGRNDDVRHVTSKVDHRASPECLPLLSAEDRWSIPKTWKWRALADLVLFVDYRGKTPAKLKSGVRLLTAKNVRKGHINLSPEEFISEAEYGAWMTRGIPKVGDVLFTTEAPMGNAAVIDLTDRFALAQRVICFQSYGAIDSEFLVMQILSDQFQFLLAKNGTGMTAKGMKASKLKQLPVALPPLAEQRRITARVRQLSNLLGELGSVQESSNATATTLLAAIMEQMSGLECPSQSDPAQLVAAYIGDPGPCLSKP